MHAESEASLDPPVVFSGDDRSARARARVAATARSYRAGSRLFRLSQQKREPCPIASRDAISEGADGLPLGSVRARAQGRTAGLMGRGCAFVGVSHSPGVIDHGLSTLSLL